MNASQENPDPPFNPGDVNEARKPHGTREQWEQFGHLLRDKRNAVGLSRVQLSRKVKLSDATIKFIETARHPPSRATLIRLINEPLLKLSWDEVPGVPTKPSEPVEKLGGTAWADSSEVLNCFLAPSYDPVDMVEDLGRYLQGSGGRVEQSNAYLDHQSAAAYRTLCKSCHVVAVLRATMPLDVAARKIVQTAGPGGVAVVALGSGDGVQEVRLTQLLAEEAPEERLDLCLLDISLPLLSGARSHAQDRLSDLPNARVWAVLCNFNHLPLYSAILAKEKEFEGRRVFCMLGGTMANLDHEPRFFAHNLQSSAPGDMLLVDVQLVRAPADRPDEIKRRDAAWNSGMSPSQAAWLAGPIRRNCPDVRNVAFHWVLNTRCPVPGSYELDAVATVEERNRRDRTFSMFRFRRYDGPSLIACLGELGWDAVDAMPYGTPGAQSSLFLFVRTRRGVSDAIH